MAAIINQSIVDLKKKTVPALEKYRALRFIKSEDCEAYCLELEIDYRTVRNKAELYANEESPGL